VVEILSESTRSKDMLKKLDLYKQTGVREYWMADPKKGWCTLTHSKRKKSLIIWSISRTAMNMPNQQILKD